MFADFWAVLSSIEQQYVANSTSQVSVAMSGFPLAMSICDLNSDWMQVNDEWTMDFFIDTLSISKADATLDPPSIPDDPTVAHNGGGAAMAVIVAQDNTWKGIDQQKGDMEARNLNNLAEEIKTMADYLGQCLSETLGLAAPLWSVLSLTRSLTKG